MSGSTVGKGREGGCTCTKENKIRQIPVYGTVHAFPSV